MNEGTSNIFLSWSGKTSNAIALTFNSFLPYLIQASNPFFSPEGISKDQDWFNQIKSQLISSKTGIVFLTKENLTKDWIFFESGSIFSKGSLCALLCDCDVSYLKEKGSIFQYFNVTLLNQKEDLLKLLHTINNVVSPSVSRTVIDKTFEKYYDEFWAAIQQSLEKTTSPACDTSRFEGKWNLTYSTRDDSFTGGENFRLTKDGKYFLEITSDSDVYYFQLNILKSDSTSIVWQKLRVVDNKPLDEVHSVENLKINPDNNTIVGEDTIGYKLTYSRRG